MVIQDDKIRSSKGVISVDGRRMVVNISKDFIEYYNFFIQRKYWVSFQLPKYGAHISIASLKHYTGVDWVKAKRYHGEVINFDYSVDMIHGGRTKGFHMFYLKVFSDDINNIKQEIGAVDGDAYHGLHITINNGKSNKYKLWHPTLITLGV